MIAAGLSVDALYEEWRDKARALLAASVAPERVHWTAADAPGLFADEIPDGIGDRPITVTREFVDVARKAILHREPERFALLYRVLWRMQVNRTLMHDATDVDVSRLRALLKSVRRDEHKMHAFVRFKEVTDEDGPRFVAWFEPQHHILAASADFFVRRFTGMRWSIVTPEAGAHWDGEQLQIGPGGARSDVPADDARDEDWRTYYRSMFNPARLKVAAKTREMPKHYWKNMPETREIASLIAEASWRSGEMVEAEPTLARKRSGAAAARIMPEEPTPVVMRVSDRGAPPATMAEVHAALPGCRSCALWRPATQVVKGEGKTDQPLLAFVGEQPGDQEDLAGRAFVGPAGQLLDRALQEAGIDRLESYLTNSVKHFKYEPRGKRRIHSRPGAGEVEACRWWVKHELDLVRPALTVALGATAAASLAGYRGPLHAVRGRTVPSREGRPVFVTVHPSYLLRLSDLDTKEREYAQFIADLGQAKALAGRLVAGDADSSLLKAS